MIQGYSPLDTGAYAGGSANPAWDGAWRAISEVPSPSGIIYNACQNYVTILPNPLSINTVELVNVWIYHDGVADDIIAVIASGSGAVGKPIGCWTRAQNSNPVGVYTWASAMAVLGSPVDQTDMTPSITIIAGTEP